MSNITLSYRREPTAAQPEAFANVPVEIIQFSDGTENVKALVGMDFAGGPINVEVRNMHSTVDLIRVGLVKDALDRTLAKTHNMSPIVQLTLKYMPQARADREFELGNGLPLKVFADILNSFNFHRVTVIEPHSDVTSALVNNLEVCKLATIVKNNITSIQDILGNDFALVAPDAGAAKRTTEVAEAIGHQGFIQCLKERDLQTGRILGVKAMVGEEVPESVLIVDDLADGGATFAFLADELRSKGVKYVALILAHGIFKDGLAVLRGKVDQLWVSNIVGDYINMQDLTAFNDGDKSDEGSN